MSPPDPESESNNAIATRRWLTRLILLVAAVAQLSRIIQVQSSTGETPFMSANDRSRWCTIAALAVNGSYEIDDLLEIKDPKTKRRTWYTIDLVQHRGADGRQHFYSSKPPLLPTIYGGVYYVVRALSGATLMNAPFAVVPMVLLIVNLVPLILFWVLLARWIDSENLDLWSSVVLTTFIAWGTYLTTFANTLNNHLPAAIAVGVSLWCIYKISIRSDKNPVWFILCGFSTSFGAANELPALSWVAAAGAILLIVDARKAIVFYTPALLPVAIAFFGANYAAHGEWKPAYAHRGLGERIAEFSTESSSTIDKLEVETLLAQVRSAGVDCADSSIVRKARRPGVFEIWDEEDQMRFGLKRSDTSPKAIEIYQWGDWYDYPGSYWTSDRKQGVDKGEPNRAKYIFHSLVGHHGIFSLTPFWLVAIAGCYAIWNQSNSTNIFREPLMLLMCAIIATSIVSIGFYLARPLEDRNYGGVSSGFRWSFWLTPLWLWLSVHGIRVAKSIMARRVTTILLLLSVFSASFPWKNPWTSPWVMQLMEYLDWI